MILYHLYIIYFYFTFILSIFIILNISSQYNKLIIYNPSQYNKLIICNPSQYNKLIICNPSQYNKINNL